MNELYYLFSCDEGMSNSSMKVEGIFNENELRKFLKENVKNKNYKGMDYDQEINTLDYWGISDINLCLLKGYICKVNINKLTSSCFNGGY